MLARAEPSSFTARGKHYGQLCLRWLLALPLLSPLPGAPNLGPKATSISILPLRGLNVLCADIFYVLWIGKASKHRLLATGVVDRGVDFLFAVIVIIFVTRIFMYHTIIGLRVSALSSEFGFFSSHFFILFFHWLFSRLFPHKLSSTILISRDLLISCQEPKSGLAYWLACWSRILLPKG